MIEALIALGIVGASVVGVAGGLGYGVWWRLRTRTRGLIPLLVGQSGTMVYLSWAAKSKALLGAWVVDLPRIIDTVDEILHERGLLGARGLFVKKLADAVFFVEDRSPSTHVNAGEYLGYSRGLWFNLDVDPDRRELTAHELMHAFEHLIQGLTYEQHRALLRIKKHFLDDDGAKSVVAETLKRLAEDDKTWTQAPSP